MPIKPDNNQTDAARMSVISNGVQALLFAEGGALTYASLKKTLGCSDEQLSAGLTALSVQLEGTGLTLVQSDTEAILAVAAEAKDIVVKKATEESARDIGDAGLEVLAVLLYEGPSTRAQIDYIRGVNSSSTLRNLLSRGLVERAGNPEDGREFIYRATTELLAHIGVAERTKLPEYSTISTELSSFKQTANHASSDSTSHNTA